MGAAPSDSLGVAHLIRAYQFNGHRGAAVDPLGLFTKASFPLRPEVCHELDPAYHGFTEADMDREVSCYRLFSRFIHPPP